VCSDQLVLKYKVIFTCVCEFYNVSAIKSRLLHTGRSLLHRWMRQLFRHPFMAIVSNYCLKRGKLWHSVLDAADGCLDRCKWPTRQRRAVRRSAAALFKSLPGSYWQPHAAMYGHWWWANPKSHGCCRHTAELLVTMSWKGKNSGYNVHWKNENPQKLCHFRPKTSRHRWLLEVTKHCSFGFGLIYRNNTTNNQIEMSDDPLIVQHRGSA